MYSCRIATKFISLQENLKNLLLWYFLLIIFFSHLSILDNFGNFDLDILQKFGTNPTADFSNGRDSVLLRFDPLLEKIAPVEVTNQRLTPTANTTTRLCSTKEEDEYYSECQSFSDKEQEQSLVQVETFTTQTNRNSSNYTIPTLPSNADTSAMKDIEQGTEIIESVHETKEFKDLSIR